jgi:predicted metal-dependent hydrolase
MADKPRKIIMELSPSDYKDYIKSANLIPYRTRVYITDTICGRAHCNAINQWVSIPKWALNKSWDYFIYYVAHELAHINNWNNNRLRNHDKKFYDCFEQLCPDKLQYHELHYKPSYGQRIEHEHVYSTMIMRDGIKTFKCHYCNKTKQDGVK